MDPFSINDTLRDRHGRNTLWIPPLPIALIALALFYFGIKTWLRADNLPPPPEAQDDEHGHGHH